VVLLGYRSPETRSLAFSVGKLGSCRSYRRFLLLHSSQTAKPAVDSASALAFELMPVIGYPHSKPGNIRRPQGAPHNRGVTSANKPNTAHLKRFSKPPTTIPHSLNRSQSFFQKGHRHDIFATTNRAIKHSHLDLEITSSQSAKRLAVAGSGQIVVELSGLDRSQCSGGNSLNQTTFQIAFTRLAGLAKDPPATPARPGLLKRPRPVPAAGTLRQRWSPRPADSRERAEIEAAWSHKEPQ